MLRYASAFALLNLALQAPSVGQSAEGGNSEAPWYAPCPNGTQTCAPFERDWDPHPGYDLTWTGNDKSRVYLSRPPYKLVRGFPSAWVYTDQKLTINGDGDRVSLYPVDCKNGASKIIQQQHIGAVIQPHGESAWEYASPNSFGEFLIKKVCRSSVAGQQTDKPKRKPHG